LGGDSSGLSLDDLESQSIQHLSSTVPAPRCTFCSGPQRAPILRLMGWRTQRLPHLLRLLLMYQANPFRARASGIFFLSRYRGVRAARRNPEPALRGISGSCTQQYRSFGPIFGFPRWKPPTLVGGERSEKEERPFRAVEKGSSKSLPCAAGSGSPTSPLLAGGVEAPRTAQRSSESALKQIFPSATRCLLRKQTVMVTLYGHQLRAKAPIRCTESAPFINTRRVCSVFSVVSSSES